MSFLDVMINFLSFILFMLTHIDEKLLFPFFSQITLYSSINLTRLICRWSQLDFVSHHSWIYFTKILHRSECPSDAFLFRPISRRNDVCLPRQTKYVQSPSIKHEIDRMPVYVKHPWSHGCSCSRQVQLLTSDCCTPPIQTPIKTPGALSQHF